MSTLTKICIVLVFVLALISCVVFYQTVSTTVNWKTAYESQLQRRNLAETDSRNHQMAAGHWRALYRDKARQVANVQRNSQNELDNRRTEIRRLTVQNAQLAGKLTELAAWLSNMDGSLKGMVDLNAVLASQLETQRTEKLKVQTELRRALEKIRDDVVKIENLMAANRVLKEGISELEQEVAILTRKIADLERGTIVKVGEGPPDVYVDAKIDATVTAVKENLASLNVGSASKVKKDMVFIIYRGAEFVGHLRIADVGTSTCAGIVYEAVKEVRVNDKATNKLD